MNINDFFFFFAHSNVEISWNLKISLAFQVSIRQILHSVFPCVDINECVSSPCQNEGTCVDQVYGFQCVCLSGYTDFICSTGKWYQLICILLTYHITCSLSSIYLFSFFRISFYLEFKIAKVDWFPHYTWSISAIFSMYQPPLFCARKSLKVFILFF